MTACIWVQYEPLGGTNPYPGFIHSAVTGDDQKPPPIGANLAQISVPAGTVVAGMEVDAGAIPPVLIPARAPPNPQTISTISVIFRFTAAEYAAWRSSADAKAQQILDALRASGGSITLTDSQFANAVNYLASIGIITTQRATAILTP